MFCPRAITVWAFLSEWKISCLSHSSFNCSQMPASLHAATMLLPWAVCTSIWRRFNTICSALVFRPRCLSDSFDPG